MGGEQYSRRLERMGSLGCGGGGVGWGVNSTQGTWREWGHWSVGVGG